jgi:plasmid rolling circle replication initiator protein Rep
MKTQAKILQDELSTDLQRSKNLFTRLQRYAGGKARALVNAVELTQSLFESAEELNNARKTSERVTRCGNYLEFHHYPTIDKTVLHEARFCQKTMLCPMCAMRRGSKLIQVYKQRIEHVRTSNKKLRLSMLTYTVKNGSDLLERFEHLQKSIRRLAERRRDFLKKGWGFNEFCKVDGWVGTYEFTNNGNGWHPHAHILVLHDTSFDYKRIVKEWGAITGDSCIMNVQAVKGNPDEAFVEVFKYALKFSELTTERNIEAYKALQGKRLVFNGGSLWGVKVPESLADDVPQEKLPYISLFFRYIKGAYMLEREGHYSPVIEEEDEKLTPEEEEQQEQDRLFIKQQIYRLKKQNGALSDQQAYEVARARLSAKRFESPASNRDWLEDG